jgi:3-deoxy-D-manno-octulosonate 8-phosphate phosphatase KdsC-like HAD superfamily phosphatase
MHDHQKAKSIRVLLSDVDGIMAVFCSIELGKS